MVIMRFSCCADKPCHSTIEEAKTMVRMVSLHKFMHITGKNVFRRSYLYLVPDGSCLL